MGPLSWRSFDHAVPEWFSSLSPNGKTIYLSFGGTGFDKQKLIDVAVELVKHSYRVVVTTGTICEPGAFPQRENLFVAKFLPGEKVCEKVDIVITHGGYGTMIDAIQKGKPVIAIPFNPEQILHASRMQEFGVAKKLFHFEFTDIIDAFTLQWEKIEQKGKKIRPSEVLRAVEEVQAHMHSYKKAIEQFNALYPIKDGAQESASIIEAIS